MNKAEVINAFKKYTGIIERTEIQICAWCVRVRECVCVCQIVCECMRERESEKERNVKSPVIILSEPRPIICRLLFSGPDDGVRTTKRQMDKQKTES